MQQKVMIIDDVKRSNKSIENVLSMDYDVIVLANEEDIFEYLQDFHKEIIAIVINLDRNKDNGFEIIKEVRNNELLHKVAIVTLSSEKNIETKIKALNYGATTFIAAPFSIEEFKNHFWNTIVSTEVFAGKETPKRDSLTDLFTRSSFLKLAQEMIGKKPAGYYVMACFDVDRFKVVNDQYGTEKGDLVLKHIAKTFLNGFIKCNGICCRINADNFAVLYPKSFSNSQEIERIRRIAAEADGNIAPLSFSIGRYYVDDLNLAVSAMYDRATIAKESIKGRYDANIATFNEEMLNLILDEQAIISEMKTALQNKEFEVWFQPQYNYATKALLGAEALVRWNHPKKGIIGPNKFIPIFEKNGFIYELDKYVWRRVFELMRKWIDEGRNPMPVSVNISRYDLFKKNLTDVIVDMMKEYDIPVDLIRLEITESAFAKSEKQVIKVVKKFISNGFTVEIDDFGSGYSSLNILKDVPAQVLKLDMRFFEGSMVNDRAGNIIESVIRMAKWLGMSVIAEGVEEKEQADYLKSVGCNYIQGYFYQKVIPLDKYEELAFNTQKEEKLLELETVEKYDNNSFWNPSSLDTLIFNTYVGAACIFEWHNDNLEVLRVNDKYAKVVFGKDGLTHDAFSIKWMDYMDDESSKITKEAILKAIETGEDVEFECVFNNLPKTVGETYLKTVIRVIARTNDRFLIYCTNENLTEKKDAYHQLDAIMTNINGGINALIYNGDGTAKIVFANEKYYSMHGYTKEQYEKEVITGNDICPEDKKRVMENAEKLIKTRGSAVYDFHCFKRDGSKMLLRCNNSVVSISGISENVILGIVTDITEISRMEQKEKELATQLKIITDNISSGIIAFTMKKGEYKEIFSNSKCFELAGYTKEEFYEKNKSIFDAVHYEDRLKARQIVSSIFRTRQPANVNYRIMKKDGESCFLQSTYTIVKMDGIEEDVCLTVLNDVTKITLANQKVIDTSHKLQAIMDNVGSGIIAISMHEDILNLIFANDKFYKIIGYSKRKFEDDGLKPFDLIFEEDRKMVSDNIKKVLNTGRPSTMEYRLKRGNDAIIWVRHRLTGIHMTDVKDVVQLSVIDDITFEKKSRDKIYDLSIAVQNMMNDTPGGFSQMKIINDHFIETVYVNKAFCEIRGISYESLVDEKKINALDFVHPDDLELVKTTIKELIETKETRNIKYRIKCANDTYHPFSVFSRATINKNGEIFVNAYYADLSVEEKKDLAIKNAVPFILSSIMANSNDLTFAKDKDFIYVCCSPAFAKLAGYESEKDIIGKTDYDLFSKEVADAYRKDDLTLLERGESLVDYVESIPSSDEIQHYSRTSKYILYNSAREIIGIYGIGRDITEYNTAFEHLKLLTDNIPGGIASYRCNLDGIKILYFNDGFAKMLGYTREEYEEISKTSVFNLVYSEDMLELKKHVDDLNYHDCPLNYFFRIHNRYDDGYKWVNIIGKISERHGENIFINTMLFDVTESKRAEEERRIHEEELNTALSQMGRNISEYDISTKTLNVSESYAEKHHIDIVNFPVPECFTIRQSISKEAKTKIVQFWEEIQRGEKRGSADIFFEHNDGSNNWEHLEFINIFDEKGKPVKTLISSDDTTKEHLQYEIEKNRPSFGDDKLLFHALFNLNTGETLEYYDANEKPVGIDGQLGFVGSVIPRVDFFVDEDERLTFHRIHNTKDLLAKYEDGEREFSIDYRRVLVDNHIVWARNILRLMKDPRSNDILLFEYCYNIEEEKIKELMTEVLTKSIYDFVARINGENKNYILITGDNKEKEIPPVVGNDFDQDIKVFCEKYVFIDDREFVIKNVSISGIRDNLKDHDQFQFTCREIRSNGDIRYKKISTYYLDKALDVLIMTREDVTQIMEEEIRKQKALSTAFEAASQASNIKTQFLSRMSHELRTPMNAIIGLVALSLMDIDKKDIIQDNIEKIGLSAQHLLSLINDILEMSRIESGKMSLSEEPFEFEHFISNINTVINQQALEKGIDYDVFIKNNIDPIYVGDSVKLQEIILNVLNNAVKFTPKNGKVGMAIEKLSGNEKNAVIRFVIMDTGVGIEEEFIDHLFEPFLQEMSSTTTSYSGTGLGLAITKNLVDMMNGSIKVTSKKGKGSIFTIDVELEISEKGKEYIDLLSTLDLAKLKVLIVDDDAIVCRSTEQTLKEMGIRATWVCSGKEAIQTIKEKNDFTTILIDWKMPEMDGIKTTIELRKDLNPITKIIIMSAYDWRSIENEAKICGVDAFVEKPLFRTTIMKVLQDVFMSDKTTKVIKEKTLAGKRILIVEDNQVNALIAKRLLEKVEMEVMTVNNGEEAIGIYESLPKNYFDAILMDIRMPIMDGITATKEIRKRNSDIPIIAMTANAFDEDVELSLSSGMNAHLSKPITPKILYDCLEKLIK